MLFAAFILGLMYGLVDMLLPIFTIQELGWTNTQYSQAFSTTNVIGGLFGMFIGGALVDFLAKKASLLFILSL